MAGKDCPMPGKMKGPYGNPGRPAPPPKKGK